MLLERLITALKVDVKQRGERPLANTELLRMLEAIQSYDDREMQMFHRLAQNAERE